MAAINSMQNYIMDSFKREIEYVGARLDNEIGYVNKRLDTARDYSGKTKTTTIQPDIVPPDIMVKMKTAKTTKQKLDNTDINKFGDCPS